MLSSRTELDTEMEKLHNAIERAKAIVDYSDDDELVLQEGAKAQSLLPLLDSLRDDEKFWTSEQIQEEIDQLTARIQNTEIIQDRIPMGRKLQRLKSLLELNGVTNNDRKPPGRSVASTRDEKSGRLEDAFYRKLVEAYSDDIVFKVHDLALLVSNIHQMKVFYTFLNHLFRSNLLSKNDRQRYALKALQRTSKTFCKSDRQLMAMQERIVQKCRQDGILLHGIDKRDANSVISTEPLPSLASNFAMLEYRVGEMLPRTSTQSQVTANTPSDGISHRAILAQVQAVGRSLKDFYAALEEHDHSRSPIAAVCSILNSLSFGQALSPNHLSDNHGFGIILDEIVDYGDVHHICSVVDQSGNEKLQKAYQEGLAIVEGAMASLANDGVTGTCIENAASKEVSTAGPRILVTVMGYLANAVTKRVRGMESLAGDSQVTVLGYLANAVTRSFRGMESPNSDCQDENSEAITLLALVFTAKIIQVSKSVEAETKVVIGGGEPREDDESTAAKLSQSPDSIRAPRSCLRDTVSSCGSMESERLSELEKSVGEIVEEQRKQRDSLSQLLDMQVKLDDRITQLVNILGYSEK